MTAWRALAAGLLVLLAACDDTDRPFVTPSEREDDAAMLPGSGVTATLDRMEDGAWRVRYAFDAPQSVIFFSRSNGDYRTATWTPLSDGAAMARVGGFDAVLFDEPVEAAAFRIAPYSDQIPQEYTPFIPFSDGGLAIHAGQFEVLAAEDSEAIAALEGNLAQYQGEQKILGVRVIAPDTAIVAGGEVTRGEGSDVSLGGTSYLYVGEAEVQEGPDYAGVIDPGLPDWLQDQLESELGAVFAAYHDLWGEGLPEKASVLYAFRGYDRPGLSNKGGALGSRLIMLESSGDALRQPSQQIGVYMRWFFAHEIAHLFQARTGAVVASQGDSWIFEGGANAMANIVLGETATENPDGLMSDYAETFDTCAAYLADGPLSEAARDGRYDAYYQCGDLMSRASAAATPDADLFALWRGLLDAAEARDNRFSTDLYLEVMRERGAPEPAIQAIRRIATETLSDPRAALADMLAEAGMAPAFADDGRLTALDLDGAS